MSSLPYFSCVQPDELVEFPPVPVGEVPGEQLLLLLLLILREFLLLHALGVRPLVGVEGHLVPAQLAVVVDLQLEQP